MSGSSEGSAEAACPNGGLQGPQPEGTEVSLAGGVLGPLPLPPVATSTRAACSHTAAARARLCACSLAPPAKRPEPVGGGRAALGGRGRRQIGEHGRGVRCACSGSGSGSRLEFDTADNRAERFAGSDGGSENGSDFGSAC